ncbi:reverse transcriptase domain-containing protein [Tanacetum coccineum]
MTSGSPTLTPDPMVESLSPFLTPFGDSNFLLEETDAFLSLDDSIPPGIDDGTYDSEGDILFLERLLNDDPTPDLPPISYPVCLINDAKKIKSSIDDPLDLNLKDLPSHLEYAFLEGTFKLPIIITKDLKKEEKEQLLKTDFLAIFKSQLIPKTRKNGTLAYRRMPLGLCNAPRTFQRCMMVIFHDMIEKTMEVFMDDFSVFVDSFSSCLSYLDTMLQRCEDTNLVLNWEKCHFIFKEGIVFGHKISKNGLEVDRAKVDVIAKLPPPTTVKGVRSFLGHADLKRSTEKLLPVSRTGTVFKLCDAIDICRSILGQRKDKYLGLTLC